MTIKPPDFFIVGAPKSGTSAMNDFLGQHPEIFMAKKELHFFGSDLAMDNTPGLDEYLRFFAEGMAGKLMGEASVWYLYSVTAAAEIKAFNPEAKIIIMLRNPFEMMPALHRQNLMDANENITDFLQALSAVDERSNGLKRPPDCEHVSCLLYSKVCLYSSQVKRYIDAFGKERVYVVIYDDFKANNLLEYRKLLTFLGVDDRFEPVVREVNAGKSLLNPRLQRLMKHPPANLKRGFRAIVPSRRVRHGLMDLTVRLNVKKSIGSDRMPNYPAELKQDIDDDIRTLGNMLSRDLSFWIDKTPGS